MVCQTITEVFEEVGLIEILVYPSTCNYFFYGYILAGIFIIMTLALYWKEKQEAVISDIISSSAISSLAVTILALIGTLTTPQIIQQDIFLYTVAFMVVIVGIWFFKD